MFDAPLGDRIGWTIVHSCWQILLVAAVARLLGGVVGRASPGARYAIYCFGLLAMFTWPAATLATLEGVPASFPSAAAAGRPAPSVPLPAEPGEAVASRADARLTAERAQPAGAGDPWYGPAAERLRAWMAPAVLADARRTLGGLTPHLAWYWLAGTLCFSLRPILGWYTVVRLRRVGCRPVPSHVEEAVDRLRQRLGVSRAIGIAQSALVTVPAVVGCLRPLILLPASSVTGLTARQLEAVLAHELAHARRYDYCINALQTLLETLLFYHPAVWWLSAAVRREREHCCDDVAVSACGDRATYAGALLALAEWRNRPLPPALAASGGPLLQRIRRIAGPPPASARGAGWAIAASLLVLLAGAVVIGRTPRAEAASAPLGKADRSDSAGSRPPSFSGHLSGRFVFHGAPPERRRITPNNDLHEVGPEPIYDDALLVGPDGGIANVFVYVRDADIRLPPITELRSPKVIRNQRLQYTPRGMGLWVHQALRVENANRVGITVMIRSARNQPINMILPSGKSHTFRFQQHEPYPVPLMDSLHPWTRSNLLIHDNPYFAVSGRDGRFKIDGLPPGEWEFQFWHEKAGFLKRDIWPRGRRTLRIDGDGTDLGTVRLKAADFDLPEPRDARRAPRRAPSRGAAADGWFRDAPYPEVGFPSVDEEDRLHLILATYHEAQDELRTAADQRAVLARLRQWVFEDLRSVHDREQRAVVWAKGRRRAEDVLTQPQRARLRQLAIQQRRHEVFLHRELLPPLELSDAQHDRAHALWQQHLARLRDVGPRRSAATANRGRRSYQQFWDEVRRVLTAEQQETYLRLRGPAPIR